MTGHVEFGPTSMPLEMELTACPESVTAARRAVSAYAQDQGADPERIALALSDAVTVLVRGLYEQFSRSDSSAALEAATEFEL
jgi:hypothetical protein